MDDWDLYIEQRAERIAEYAPADECGGFDRRAVLARARAAREAHKLGLRPTDENGNPLETIPLDDLKK